MARFCRRSGRQIRFKLGLKPSGLDKPIQRNLACGF